MIIEKIKRLMLLCGSMFAASLTGTAQSLDKMQWFIWGTERNVY